MCTAANFYWVCTHFSTISSLGVSSLKDLFFPWETAEMLSCFTPYWSPCFPPMYPPVETPGLHMVSGLSSTLKPAEKIHPAHLVPNLRPGAKPKLRWNQRHGAAPPNPGRCLETWLQLSAGERTECGLWCGGAARSWRMCCERLCLRAPCPKERGG